jgi:putative hydrolase of the HAD superfamily
MKKPDIEIFDFVINENQLKPTETIFIDDSLQHIEAATLVGLQSYHLKNNEDITELF